jgi:malonyl CoA-acyl carrier protein transacylase
MDGLGATVFVEAGPGDVLAKLTRRAVPGASVFAVGTPEKARHAVDGVSSLAE